MKTFDNCMLPKSFFYTKERKCLMETALLMGGSMFSVELLCLGVEDINFVTQ